MMMSICNLRRWDHAFAEYCWFQKKMANEELKGFSLIVAAFLASVLRTIPHIARRFLGRHAHFYLTFAMLTSQFQVCLL